MLLLLLACQPKLPLDRNTFNQRAVEANLPLYWRSDDDGTLTPEELAVLWPSQRERYVHNGAFTPLFEEAYQQLSMPAPAPPADARRLALLQELKSSRPALVTADLQDLSPSESSLIAHLRAAAQPLELLYRRQRGADGISPAPDPESQAVFGRNQGPWCEAPQTRELPACSATDPPVARVSGLYPFALASQAGFCARLSAMPGSELLLDPFSVLVERTGALVAVPYTKVWPAEMEAVARELDAAGNAIGPEEAPLKAYLAAAATAFRTNHWFEADEAWAKMNVTNSRWYLRIGPDEVQSDPCGIHAIFHMSFAKINQGSLQWQRLLSPHREEMEATVAALAGPPYVARPVDFQLPDFIDIVLNAGDSRAPAGGTIGQSLPNWGPVAGRGRTVAMTNLGQDPDSRASLDRQARSLFCSDLLPDWTSASEPLLLSTILHEAAHNLGPTGAWRVEGKSDVEAMGGPTAATMEELKAQITAMMLSEWLVPRGLAKASLVRQAHVADLLWMFGQISEGMFQGEDPLPYAQLSAVQLGVLLEKGAVQWRAGEPAGTDVGCFSVDWTAWTPAIEGLAQQVLSLKARNDGEGARLLLTRHVSGDGPGVPLRSLISERIRREPRVTYVYEGPG